MRKKKIYQTETRNKYVNMNTNIDMPEPAILNLGFIQIGLYIKGDSKVFGVCLYDKYSYDTTLGFTILK